jgi:hypothetical protein
MSNIILARQKIQGIRERLLAQGDHEAANQLEDVIGLMHRRPAARRMERHSRPVSPAVRERIIELSETTEMHSAEIAAEVGVNPGRVSEILQGDR